MKCKHNISILFFLLAGIILYSCKADISGVDSRIYDPIVLGTSVVNLHKSGTYPGPATLQVTGYFNQVSNNMIVEIDSTFRSVMPSSDTSFYRIILLGNTPERKHYYTWKVTGSDGDSLSGGITQTQVIPESNTGKAFTFDIDF